MQQKGDSHCEYPVKIYNKDDFLRRHYPHQVKRVEVNYFLSARLRAPLLLFWFKLYNYFNILQVFFFLIVFETKLASTRMAKK